MADMCFFLLSALVGNSPFIWTSFEIIFAQVAVMSVFLKGYVMQVALIVKFFEDGTPFRSRGISFFNDAEVRFNAFSPVLN